MMGTVWWIALGLALAATGVSLGVLGWRMRRERRDADAVDAGRAARIRAAASAEVHGSDPVVEYREPSMGGKSDRLAETHRASRQRRHDNGQRAQRRREPTAAEVMAATGYSPTESVDLFTDSYPSPRPRSGPRGDWGSASGQGRYADLPPDLPSGGGGIFRPDGDEDGGTR